MKSIEIGRLLRPIQSVFRCCPICGGRCLRFDDTDYESGEDNGIIAGNCENCGYIFQFSSKVLHDVQNHPERHSFEIKD